MVSWNFGLVMIMTLVTRYEIKKKSHMFKHNSISLVFLNREIMWSSTFFLIVSHPRNDTVTWLFKINHLSNATKRHIEFDEFNYKPQINWFAWPKTCVISGCTNPISRCARKRTHSVGWKRKHKQIWPLGQKTKLRSKTEHR